MSVQTVATALAARLRAITSPVALSRVYADPREAADIGAYPVAIIEQDADRDHRWRMAASGLGRHDYTMTIWLLVGSDQQPLPELHARAVPWSEAIARALWSGITLGGAAEWTGDGGDGLLTYRIGAITWGGRRHYGLQVSLPITEKTPLAMDA